MEDITRTWDSLKNAFVKIHLKELNGEKLIYYEKVLYRRMYFLKPFIYHPEKELFQDSNPQTNKILINNNSKYNSNDKVVDFNINLNSKCESKNVYKRQTLLHTYANFLQKIVLQQESVDTQHKCSAVILKSIFKYQTK